MVLLFRYKFPFIPPLCLVMILRENIPLRALLTFLTLSYSRLLAVLATDILRSSCAWVYGQSRPTALSLSTAQLLFSDLSGEAIHIPGGLLWTSRGRCPQSLYHTAILQFMALSHPHFSQLFYILCKTYERRNFHNLFNIIVWLSRTLAGPVSWIILSNSSSHVSLSTHQFKWSIDQLTSKFL